MNNEEIAEKLRPSTVRVIAEFGETAIDFEGMGAGTGIVYDVDNGYVITNAHVVEGASVVKIALADTTKTRSARVLGRSQCDDLAVLKVENTSGLEAAKLGDSDQTKVGADVVALGYPLSFDLGTDLSVNAGTVSQLGATLAEYEELIKIDAAINPGNSGGPLVNRRGEVIGINTLGINGAQNQNYSIAMSQAKPIIEQLEQGKNKNFLGLNLVPNTYADYFGTEEGLVVAGVASGSPASQAGVQPADLILKMEGTSVNDTATVCDILRSRTDGEQIKVQIFRAATGDILEGELTIGAQGASLGLPTLVSVGNVNQGSEPTDDGSDDAASTEPAASTGDEALLVNATFDEDAGSWPVGDADGLSVALADGDYNVNLIDANQYISLYPDESADLGDGVVAAEVRPEGTGFAGIVARYSDTDAGRSMYVCWISNEGKFGCSKDVNNNWSVVVQPQAHAAVKPDTYNKLTMVAIGEQLSFQVNDQEVASFTDNSLTRGGWGVYVENFDTGFIAHYNQVVVGTLE